MSLDGRNDFDFLFGVWHVTNRKLEDPRPEASPVWHDFQSIVESTPILGGLGNCDDYYFPDFPGRGAHQGFAFRLFDPADRVWRIWWAFHPGGGDLEPSVVGRFIDGEGHFEGNDIYDDRPIRVRYSWTEITPVSARWEQSFAFDDLDRVVNWIMEFERAAGGGA